MSTEPRSQANGPSGISASYADTIGGTPLVRLGRLSEHAGLTANLVVKLEIANPSGTIADRLALATVDIMAESGVIDLAAQETTLVAVASVRLSRSLALVAAGRRLGLILATGADTPAQRLSQLKALGANLASVDSVAAEDLAARADAIAAVSEQRARITEAHERAAAIRAGRLLADEIAAQSAGRIDVIVVGPDTLGMLASCAERLRVHVPRLVVVGMTDGVSPGPDADAAVLDEIIRVPDDMADSIAALVTQLEALPEARDTGRAIAAALTLAARADMAGKTILAFAGA